MAEDLLIKERGFRQQNEELEQKARDLMKRIDSAINTYNVAYSAHDTKIDHSNCLKQSIVTTQTENKSEISVKRNSSLPHIFGQLSPVSSKLETQNSIDNDVFKKKSLVNTSIVNLFKSKIDILQNELETLRTEYRKQSDVCKNLESENKKLEAKLQTELGLSKETIAKLENANKELQCQCQGLNAENLIAKKDLDKLQKQIKASNQQVSNYNMRLNRSLEINDKLKLALKHSQMDEKELRSEIKKLQEDKRLAVNNLVKQVSELIQIFKKQMLIVDNLKKQNACLIAIGQLKFTKEDFARLLDQKFRSIR